MTFTPLRALFLIVILAAGVLFGFAIWQPDWHTTTSNRLAVTGVDVFFGGIAALLTMVK